MCDFESALQDARDALAIKPDARAASALPRLQAVVDARRRGSDLRVAPHDSLCPGLHAATTSQVRVHSNLVVTLRQVPLSSTGGRLWHAGQVLAHWLCSPSSHGSKLLAKHDSVNSSFLEVGSGVGLVGLAIAASTSHLAIQMTDCDREALDNLKVELHLNAYQTASAVGQRVDVVEFDYTSVSALAAGKYDVVAGAVACQPGRCACSAVDASWGWDSVLARRPCGDCR
eukprot:4735701-Amphidinium_carterae.1